MVKKRILALVLGIVMVVSTSGCTVDVVEIKTDSTVDSEMYEASSFQEFCDIVVAEGFLVDPLSVHFTVTDAADYGVVFSEEDYNLGTISWDTIDDGYEYTRQAFEQLKTYNRDKLTKSEQLTYDSLYEYLETQLMYEGTGKLYNAFAPSSGIIANLSTNFVEYQFYDEEDIELYFLYLQDIENYMEQLFDFARDQAEEGYFMPDYVIDEVIEQCEGYINADEEALLITFEDKLDDMDLDDSTKEKYISLNEEYVETYYTPVYQNTIDVLEELRGSCTNEGGLCNYGEMGLNYYKAILRDKTSSLYTPEELIDMLDDEMSDLLNSMSAIYMMHSDVYEDYMEYDFEIKDPQESLDYILDAMGKDFPTPITTEYSLEYQNEACEVEGTIAYYVKCRIDNIHVNSIKLNGSAVAESGLTLYTTLAHEGFPGHLYQFTSFYGDESVPTVRKLLDFIGSTEGWAEYSSDCMVDYLDIDDSMKDLIRLDSMFSYVLISRLDLGVNYEGWTYSDASDYLSQYITSANVEDLYYYVIGDPGLLLPYTFGNILMCDLREEAEETLGNGFDAMEYHQWLLDVGIAPFSVYERELEEWLSEQAD